jgi:hypothetical protein
MWLIIVIATLALALPAPAVAAPCGGTFQYDTEGYEWDFWAPAPLFGTFDDGGGRVTRSAVDSYDRWGGLFVGGDAVMNAYGSPTASADACSVEDGGRERVFPRLTVQGLQVQRKVHVSETGLPGARILNLVHNPGTEARTTSIQVGDDRTDGELYVGDLGSDEGTSVRSSSDGDSELTGADRWAVTNDGGRDLSLAHVFDGPGAVDRVDVATMTAADDAMRADQLMYRWDDVTIAPGGTAAYLSFEVQQGVPGEIIAAEDEAARLSALAYAAAPLARIYAGMSDDEIAAVRNWPRPAPTAAFAAAAGASDRAPVALSAAGSIASPIPGACAELTYAWSFGATGPAPAVGLAAGAHAISLTVTNSCGESATTTRTIEVADATPPTATLRLSRPGLTVRLRATEPTTAALTATTRRGRTIARARTTLEPGRTRTIRLKPKRRAARGRITVTARITDTAGNTTTLRRRTRGV